MAPATCDLTQAEQRIQFHLLDTLEFFAAAGSLDHLPQLGDILQAVDQPGIGGFAIATGPARFLVIGLHRLRQIEVRHESHIGLIDAHAESDGRNHNHRFFRQETALMRRPHVGSQTGMIGQRIEAFLLQPVCGLLGLVARQAVNNTGMTAMLGFQKFEQLTPAILLEADLVADVGPVKA